MSAVCKNCGSSDAIIRYGTVESEAYEEVSIRFGDGQVVVDGSGVIENDGGFDSGSFTSDGFQCTDCGARKFRIEDLVMPSSFPAEGDPSPGTVVWTHDRVLRRVERVEIVSNSTRVYLEGESAWFDANDLSPAQPWEVGRLAA